MVGNKQDLLLNEGSVFHHIFSFFCSVGWSVDQNVGGFGEEPGIKVQLINLVRSVRTVMRGLYAAELFCN